MLSLKFIDSYNLHYILLFQILDDINIIFLSVIVIISLPIIYLSGGIRKGLQEGGKWFAGGLAFGAGEKAVDYIEGALTGNKSSGSSQDNNSEGSSGSSDSSSFKGNSSSGNSGGKSSSSQREGSSGSSSSSQREGGNLSGGTTGGSNTSK
jgi:hypothetical protein